MGNEKTFNLKIGFLNVGQGDTIVISCPETHEGIIVDCKDFRVTRDYLREEGITRLLGIIISHLHADHYSGVLPLLKGESEGSQLLENMGGYVVPECEVLAFNQGYVKKLKELKVDTDNDNHSSDVHAKGPKPIQTCQGLFEWTEKYPERYTDILIRQTTAVPFQSNGALINSIELFHPHVAHIARLEAKGLNNTSVVLKVNGPGSSALLTGDLEPFGWRHLAERHADLHCDVLKFPHHGGAWNKEDVEHLLDTVNPSIVVISVGSEGVKYNHPNHSVLAALKERHHIRLLCTQATDICQKPVLNQRESVLKVLQVQAESLGRKLIGSRRGCPCAGTVVISLADKACVLQQEAHFHQQSIILPHFANYQCYFPSSDEKHSELALC